LSRLESPPSHGCHTSRTAGALGSCHVATM
jgi:hypothetical protein